MNKNKKSILIGLCLGNGGLSKPDQWNSVSIEIEHSEKQKEYLEYKTNLLNSLLGGKKIQIHKRIRERKGNYNTSYRIRKGDKYFRIIRKMLYKNNIKTYSLKVLNKLTDHSIAIWFMDDGSLSLRKNEIGKIKSCQFKLSTCTSIEQNKIIQSFFKKRYNVTFSIVKHMISKDGTILYSLLCGTKEYLKIAKVIDKYIIPSMKYKTEILRFQECQTSINR